MPKLAIIVGSRLLKKLALTLVRPERVTRQRLVKMFFVVSAKFDMFSSKEILGIFSTSEKAKEAIEVMVKRTLTEPIGGDYEDLTTDEYRGCFSIDTIACELDSLKVFQSGDLVY
jgi:hypothetical protein